MSMATTARAETQRFAQTWAHAALGLDVPWLQADCLRQGWGEMHIGSAIGGTPLCLHGQVYRHGLGTHADSDIRLTTTGQATRFRALVGIDDNPATRANAQNTKLIFSAEVAGREIWRSPALSVGDAPAVADVAVPGATIIMLKVRAVDTDTYAHANWVDIAIELEDGTTCGFDQAFAGQRLPAHPLYSFTYDGKSSAELLPTWAISQEAYRDGDGTAVHRTTYTDPVTGLECRLEMKIFADCPAVEWVVWFSNAGDRDAPILADIRAMDYVWGTQRAATPAAGALVLHRARGSQSSVNDFLYQQDTLAPSSTIEMAAGGGRSSNQWLPFVNLQSGDEGMIIGIGWTGQWALDLQRDAGSLVQVRAGQQRTHLSLRPGETIRTPRMLVVFWQGEPLDGNNLLRRCMVHHYTPFPNGKPLVPPLTAGAWGGMQTADHLANLTEYHRQGVQPDYYWVDAGWFGATDHYRPLESGSDWWRQVGNWYPDAHAHPDGMKPISDAAHAAGMGFLLWVEPERAMSGTQLPTEHPDWFLGEPGPEQSLLLNLGHPAARAWAIETLSRMIRDFGIDCYRQDFNLFEPLPYWAAAEAPDRIGAIENGHVQGLYAFWDALLARFPHLLIDNCASGGRRLDLEMFSRSTPLWRSDLQCSPEFTSIGSQVHTCGLSYWVPFHGTSAGYRPGDTYNFRSALSAALNFTALLAPEEPATIPDYPWAWHHRMIADYHRARPLYAGDYYPLTTLTSLSTDWCAYQMHRPDLGEGMLLAFRREESPFVTADFTLHGLEADATYQLEDADTGVTRQERGSALGTYGLRVTLDQPRSSRLVFYRKM